MIRLRSNELRPRILTLVNNQEGFFLTDHGGLNFQGARTIVVIVYCDVEYVGDYENRRSQSEYIFKLANAAFS